MAAVERQVQLLALIQVRRGHRHRHDRRVVTADDKVREDWFIAMALVWIAQMMKPCARRAKAGYGQAKTTSVLLAVYAALNV